MYTYVHTYIHTNIHTYTLDHSSLPTLAFHSARPTTVVSSAHMIVTVSTIRDASKVATPFPSLGHTFTCSVVLGNTHHHHFLRVVHREGSTAVAARRTILIELIIISIGIYMYARMYVCMYVCIISERAKRASSVMFVFNRDFRYVYIYIYIYLYVAVRQPLRACPDIIAKKRP